MIAQGVCVAVGQGVMVSTADGRVPVGVVSGERVEVNDPSVGRPVSISVAGGVAEIMVRAGVIVAVGVGRVK